MPGNVVIISKCIQCSDLLRPNSTRICNIDNVPIGIPAPPIVICASTYYILHMLYCSVIDGIGRVYKYKFRVIHAEFIRQASSSHCLYFCTRPRLFQFAVLPTYRQTLIPAPKAGFLRESSPRFAPLKLRNIDICFSKALQYLVHGAISLETFQLDTNTYSILTHYRHISVLRVYLQSTIKKLSIVILLLYSLCRHNLRRIWGKK